MLLWGLALVLATAATTFLLHRKLTHGRGPEPDTIFWDVFAGLTVIAPAILVPSVQWPPAGLVMVALAGTTAAGTLAAIRKVERVQAADPWRRAGFADDSARHTEILTQWRRYELDPALPGHVRRPDHGNRSPRQGHAGGRALQGDCGHRLQGRRRAPCRGPA